MTSVMSATVLQYVILKVNGKCHQQKTNSEKKLCLFVFLVCLRNASEMARMRDESSAGKN